MSNFLNLGRDVDISQFKQTKLGKNMSLNINQYIDQRRNVEMTYRKLQGILPNTCSNILCNFEVIDTFLGIYVLPKLKQEDINVINRSTHTIRLKEYLKIFQLNSFEKPNPRCIHG